MNLKLLAISLLFIGCSEVPINQEEMVRQIKFCYDNNLEPVQLRGIGGRIFAVECRVK